MNSLRLIVGLGNPGPTYAEHRHNVGKMVLDMLAGRSSGSWRARGRAAAIEDRFGPLPGVRVVLAKPGSYMNTSGGPVAELLAYYKVTPDQLIVVHDELDIPYETVRLKFGGGDNGHNGLRSIRGALDTGDFSRVRVGIGRPSGRMNTADYVLSSFNSAERKELPFVVDRAADAVQALVTEGLVRAQNTFH